MYVDDSGDTGLAQSPTAYFGLSGLVVHEYEWRNFINFLIDFRRTLKSVYGLPIRAEIHCYDFMNKSVFGLQKHERLAVLRNCLDELAKFNSISITNVIVSKQGKNPQFDVFHAAWGTLFQRFENTMINGNFPGGHRNDHGLIVTDDTSGQNLVRLTRKMAVFNYIPHDPRYGPGARNIPIRRVIEDPHEKNSADTLPIQFCDVVSYFLTQRFAPNSYIRRKKAQLYFDRLGPVSNRRASRFNSLGIVVL